MSIISLEEAKLHLNVDHDYDDSTIQLKLDAAEQIAIEFIQRKVYATQDEMDASTEERPMLVNAMFKAAVMLILGDLYSNREDVKAAEAITSAQRILEPMRIKIGV